jgi:beta-galactosidase
LTAADITIQRDTVFDMRRWLLFSEGCPGGRAIYVGLPAKGEVLGSLIDELITELGMKKGPDVPSGVMARQIDTNHFLYLNVSYEPREIKMNGKSRSILFDKDYTGNFTIAPFEPEFVEIE